MHDTTRPSTAMLHVTAQHRTAMLHDTENMTQKTAVLHDTVHSTAQHSTAHNPQNPTSECSPVFMMNQFALDNGTSAFNPFSNILLTYLSAPPSMKCGTGS